MHTEIKVMFKVNPSIVDPARFLKTVNCGHDVAKIDPPPGPKWWPFVSVTLNEGDERVVALLHLLHQHEINWVEVHADVYSASELLASRLVFLYPNGQCELNGGVDFGTSYDLTGACPRCGTGARQRSALIVGGDDVANLRDAIAAETYYGDILIRDTVATALQDAAVTGLELHRVYHSTGSGQQRLPWFNILAERTLPRMSPLTTGIIRGRVCPVCERQAHCATQKLPMRIVYRKEDLSDAQDVNASWEWFGYTKDDLPYPEGFVARPGILVSPKVVKILMDHGVTAFDFIPLRVETDQSKPQQ